MIRFFSRRCRCSAIDFSAHFDPKYKTIVYSREASLTLMELKCLKLGSVERAPLSIRCISIIPVIPPSSPHRSTVLVRIYSPCATVRLICI